MQDDPLTLEQCQMLAECIQAQNDILFGTGIFNTEAGQAMVAANVASNTALSNATANKKQNVDTFDILPIVKKTGLGALGGAISGGAAGAIGGPSALFGAGVGGLGGGAGGLIIGLYEEIEDLTNAPGDVQSMVAIFKQAVHGVLPPGTAVLPNGLEAVGEAYQQAFQNLQSFLNMTAQQYQDGINRFMEECPGSPFGP